MKIEFGGEIVDALYIHVPFCIKKCDYCDFLSYKYRKSDKNRYVEYLLKEIAMYPKYSYNTVYFGGGTPSILEGDDLKKIIDALDINRGAEVTLEMNPGTVDEKKIEDFFKFGINRVSIGVQSFNNETLKLLGRIHSRESAISAFKRARKVGFKNISIDIMFAVPNQTMEDLKEDLDMARELNPEHISIYSLIWEEGTKFWELKESGVLKEADNDLDGEMYEYIIKFLKENGYVHYEISSFAKQGFESKHNSLYWENREYLGLGPGAVGYIAKERYSNRRTLLEYIEDIDKGKKPILESNLENEVEIEENRVVLALRMLEKGVEMKAKQHIEGAEELLKKGLLIKKDKKYYLSKRGLLLANDVFISFIET